MVVILIMISLIKGIYQHCFQKSKYSLLIIGLDNAGKTVRRHNAIFIDCARGHQRIENRERPGTGHVAIGIGRKRAGYQRVEAKDGRMRI